MAKQLGIFWTEIRLHRKITWCLQRTKSTNRYFLIYFFTSLLRLYLLHVFSTFRPLKRAENSWSFRWRWTAKALQEVNKHGGPTTQSSGWWFNPSPQKKTLQQVKVDQFGNLTVILRVENSNEIIETITSIVYHGDHRVKQNTHPHTHTQFLLFFLGEGGVPMYRHNTPQFISQLVWS